MKKKEVPLEEIYDLFAIRIIIDTPRENEKVDCWRVYSIITDHYRPNIDRLRDWISIPKVNGYEALHTTVMSNEGQWVEVQIRSKRMDEIAEKGYAAVSSLKEYGPRSFENMKEAEVIGQLRNSGVDAVLTIVMLDKQRERYYIPGRVYYTPYIVYHRRFWGYYSTMYDRI